MVPSSGSPLGALAADFGVTGAGAGWTGAEGAVGAEVDFAAVAPAMTSGVILEMVAAGTPAFDRSLTAL